ncbi:MAG: prolyl oligopeptidase family serine peptidase, partial [Gemmatimonadetes bacterium]|nr:prolyl oligopeptidase family serine peptidase [Gemmatimonadota bacterium]
HMTNSNNNSELYEDSIREAKEAAAVFFRSERVDFLQISSSLHPEAKSAIVVHKPSRPSPILLFTHGWHMSVQRPAEDTGNPYPGFLSVQVDMRGRAFSAGQPDANGFELYDVYDALQFAREDYADLIVDPERVYFVGGSGGGGNALGLAGKFPDLFVSITANFGISDYADWYERDAVGEFRDELNPWVGCSPEQNRMAYASRGGITTVENLLSPVYMAHGELDPRVPVSQSRVYYEKALSLDKQVHYLELAGVGDRSHLGKITDKQSASFAAFCDRALVDHQAPPVLPQSGELVVAGYLVTKHFTVFLDSIDHVARIRYDLDLREVDFVDGAGVISWR